MITPDKLIELTRSNEILAAITQNYIIDENTYVQALLNSIGYEEAQLDRQKTAVAQLITDVRKSAGGGSGIDSFLQEYSLDTEEGVVLMCIAEALLRIPDSETADALIEDKLSDTQWGKHFMQSDSLFVNASTWGLMLSGKITGLGKARDDKPSNTLGRMIDRLGEPVIRAAMNQAMKIMGKQFVLGRTIDEALKAGDANRKKGYTHSFDMLGEAALTAEDAKRYHQSYYDAITEIGKHQYTGDVPRPGISIKLSALHPRYEESQRDRVLSELYSSVVKLIEHARALDIQLSIDAEEMDRLELSLHLFQKLYCSSAAKDWGNLGLVVQAYSTRALPVLHWVNTLAKEQGIPIPVRLVKGAYWDSEIKLCQQQGLLGYPVYTRKVNTDVSYLACANYLLSQAQGNIFPQFATHNAQTASTILHFSEKYNNPNFEFQRLHGMGHELYDEILAQEKSKGKTTYARIYAPVGAHKDLLPYLVRRLLENGANTSFVHKLVDPNTPVESLATHPIREAQQYESFRNMAIPLPTDIFTDRQNSTSANLHIEGHREAFLDKVQSFHDKTYDACTLIDGERIAGETLVVQSPYNRNQQVGTVQLADAATADLALQSAKQAMPAWNKMGMKKRAEIVNKIADLYEVHLHELISLCTREAGKVLQDGIDEIREAVDFCRYYAAEAEKNWHEPLLMPGPTGETNELHVGGRGVFVCISPWNFPLAIFTGQIVAALVTGNAVVAKPAETTNLIAYRAVELMHEAGVPCEVLQLVCGRGSVVGASLTAQSATDGVCFTGSTATAQRINMALASRENAPISPLIAETGGQNAMIVDSTSLPEQVVTDVVHSAFMSAGQRCSALRVLYVQADVADKVIDLLKGAMQELVIGNPECYKTDIGPVIDEAAQSGLLAHIEEMKTNGSLIYQTRVNTDTTNSTFVPPTAFEIQSISQLEKEQFGPILHVIRFERNDLPKVIEEINSTGYGLTFGIHSRNETFYQQVAQRIDAGNIYINRNQIGAIVGVNPFGGHGLSGTGPKAGGPHYLTRFINEKTVSNNITAIGGNATLLAMGGEG